MKNSIFEITGIIEEMSKPEEGINANNKPYRKQLFVVKAMDKYPSTVAFTAMNDKVDDLSFYHAGSEITVTFKINTSLHKGKNYNNMFILGFGSENNRN